MTSSRHTHGEQHLHVGSDLAESAFVAANVQVFEGRVLRPGANGGSRFGDDVWEFRDAILGPIPNLRINFARVRNVRMRVALKEYAYLRLRERPLRVHANRKGARRVKAQTVGKELSLLIATLDRFQQMQEIDGFGQITQPDADRLLAVLREERLDPSSVQNYVSVLQKYGRLSSKLTFHGLTFIPWEGRRPGRVSGYVNDGENRTPDIPHEVLSPLLQWAERYVLDFAQDILAALQRERTPAKERSMVAAAVVGIPTRQGAGSGRRFAGDVADRVHALRQELLSRGIGIPTGHHKGDPPQGAEWLALDARPTEPFANSTNPAAGKISRLDLAVMLGWERWQTALWEKCPDAFRDLLEVVGTDVDVARAKDPESLVALRGVGLSQGSALSEARHLLTACWILCAYYSGMRFSEVASLKPGAAAHVESADGLRMIPVLNSVVHKHQADGGRPDEWATLPITHEAVRVAEQVRECLGDRESAYLFSPIRAGEHLSEQVTSEVSLQRNKALNRFAHHVSYLARTSVRTPAIPPWRGEAWHFSAQQFRETLAASIARAPGGVIAGSIQFKQRSVSTFEGYAGRAAEKLTLDVESARNDAELDVFQELFSDFRRGVRFAGPRAAELHNDFAEVDREVQARGMTDAELRDYLKHRLHNVHVGPLNYCFFDPKRALCRSSADAAEGPLLAACRQRQCANSTFGAEHLKAWEYQERDANRLLTENRRRLTVLQIATLESARDDARSVREEIQRGLANNSTEDVA